MNMEKSLFKNIEEFQKYVKINKTTDFENTLLPFEKDAVEDYIINHLSRKLYNKLLVFFNNEDADPDQALEDLLPYVQRPLARFTLFIASPFLNINIGTTGFTTTGNNSNMVPASAQRVQNLDKGLESTGWNAIEIMLKFLEENKENYPEWVNSKAYTMNINGLVNTAAEFNNEYDIGNSRLKFLKYRAEISRVEQLYIIPLISQELYDEIIDQLRTNTVIEANLKLLKKLRTAIVMYALSDLQNDNYERKAVAFLSEAKKILDEDPDNYPAYKNSSSFRGLNNSKNKSSINESSIFISGGFFSS